MNLIKYIFIGKLTILILGVWSIFSIGIIVYLLNKQEEEKYKFQQCLNQPKIIEIFPCSPPVICPKQ